MRLSLAMSALLCVLGIMVITGPDASPEYEDVVVNTHSTKEESGSATPARFVYIQFPGEDSRMIQLQNVSDVISERLSKYSTEQ